MHHTDTDTHTGMHTQRMGSNRGMKDESPLEQCSGLSGDLVVGAEKGIWSRASLLPPPTPHDDMQLVIPVAHKKGLVWGGIRGGEWGKGEGQQGKTRGGGGMDRKGKEGGRMELGEGGFLRVGGLAMP